MFCMQFKDNMGCCNTSNGEFKEMNNFLIAVLVGATLAVLLNLSGLSMIFYGIVVMASDCCSYCMSYLFVVSYVFLSTGLFLML